MAFRDIGVVPARSVVKSWIAVMRADQQAAEDLGTFAFANFSSWYAQRGDAAAETGGLANHDALDDPEKEEEEGKDSEKLSPFLLWVAWSSQSRKWRELREHGFSPSELRKMCADQWMRFERDVCSTEDADAGTSEKPSERGFLATLLKERTTAPSGGGGAS